MLFASFGQFFTAFPEFQRRIQIEAALLEALDDIDQFVPRFLIPQFANGLHSAIPPVPR
ncbi:hypothetical protein MPHL43072_22410 [Mycolicibacterium phlei DSM 43072]|uniref:Uncharacterized protein n=1 Tax=Mycolicibacterium phlei DSM 43239 = CCUG 21000 TaxID=1226750 RepID=A0A5N5V341_MYCPH|nr:hypothetical protein MPHL21000_12240 [Mycolicibacterium phlei DSM 43239 = CCUG 21000]KXW65772.1 hypothetical protein MPHL43239_09705 [Mycolicibacterium phlei DSM 43239 = CCUG 21000]KXW66119.1 hypothetical protein MPHL43070_21190 [Mycolicibacterium phlei DSM 43070]KXW68485.1 hypothetical protein MPHL43072_22410 [Mycolicibacterium phlei DSM 43072]